MKNMNWRTLIEIIGVLAIVLSLIFVGLQIRQDQVLARSELGSRALEIRITLELHSTDPGFAETFAKMLNKPDELTDDEMVQVNGFLRAAKTLFIRECYLKSMGVYAECDAMLKNNAPYYFGSRYAQAWWQKEWRVSPYSPEWMNDEVLNLNPDASRSMLREISERF